MNDQELDAQILTETGDDLTQLDLDIARKVMGWHVCATGRCDYVAGDHKGLWTENRNGVNWPHGKIQDFTPSQYIGDAMQVLDKADGMWELTRCVEHEVLDDDSTPYVLRYRCSLRFGDNLGHSSGCVTASEAVCRAALNAVSRPST